MVFGSTLRKDEIDGFVLNFKQKSPYSKNYFIGLKRKGYPEPTMGDRVNYRFHPAGAGREESSKVVDVKPLNRCVYHYDSGMIDPQPVTMIFPDSMRHLPAAMSQVTPAVSEQDGQQMPDLGAVMGKLVHGQEAMIDMLRANARSRPEQLKEFRSEYVEASDDEKKIREVSRIVQSVLDAVEGKNRDRMG